MVKNFALLMGLLATIISSPASQWKLVWSDEFNYHGLPDDTKWGYEVGFLRNKESQYYTKARPENARVENGMLIIEGRKENLKTTNGDAIVYTSASLSTLNKACWQYGRFEMRAKLPQGNGVWPAFWTLGTNITQVHWPACGEIDTMEFVGKEPDAIHGTVHYALDGKHQADEGQWKTSRPYDDFHVYAMEWYPDRIDFFFDHEKYHTVLLDKMAKGQGNPFHKPHYMLINFALGGSWGGPIDDAILPQQYLIDYVRVYQQNGLAAQAAAATAPGP